MVATPKDVRYFPMVTPLLLGGAKSCAIARAVGAKAARIKAWKILVG